MSPKMVTRLLFIAGIAVALIGLAMLFGGTPCSYLPLASFCWA